ncbi:MAG: EFR1 family ferrodoxin [Promethearchaeota archaeon]|jgi:Pyruvate/2-oxoacid:ferredoxin oxidoreductase delta subunit/flavodoxin
MNIGIFYFSATGITETISNHIATVLEDNQHSVKLLNIISPKNRESIRDFLEFDAIFFGFPVFGGKPPSIAENWMRTLAGGSKKCSMFFTYGARALEWAHQTTYFLLTQGNFQVVLSAEFIGKHSFSIAEGCSLADNRPNEIDLDVAREFALESVKRFQEDVKFQLDLSGFTYSPQETKERVGPWAEFYPSRKDNECSMCMLCEKECPASAFDADSGEPNRKLCITCMHCVSICPDNVIHLGNVTQLFKQFIDKRGLTEDNVSKKRSRIIY